METRKLCSFKLPESSRGKLDRLAAGLGVSKTEVIVLALAGMDLPDNRFKKEGPDRDIAKAILAYCTAPAGVLAASYAVDAHTKLNAVLEPTADGSAFVVRELDPPKTFAELKAALEKLAPPTDYWRTQPAIPANSATVENQICVM